MEKNLWIRQQEKHTQQIVNMYKQGKVAKDIIREYNLTASVFYKWVSDYNQSQPFSENDNRSPEQVALIR